MMRRIGMQQLVGTRLRTQIMSPLDSRGMFFYNYMQSTVFEGTIKVMLSKSIQGFSLPQEGN